MLEKNKGQRLKDRQVLNTLAFVIRGPSSVLPIRFWPGYLGHYRQAFALDRFSILIENPGCLMYT